MPARLVRTDTIVDIADFGALPGTDGTHATTNAAAFAAAFAVSTKVAVPATGLTQWYAFAPITLPLGAEIFGQGPTLTRLRYYPGASSAPALRFATGLSRGRLSGFRLNGPVVYPASTHTGISFDRSQFNWVSDVWIEDFATGVTFNTDAAAPYSAHNVLERFEIQRITRVGIFLGGGSNAETVGPGRCQSVINAAGTEGVSIYLSGKFTLPLGVDGPNGIVIRSVACDTAFECLRIENARGVLVTGCYFEPFDGTPPRRMLNIDAASEDISLVGNAFSPPTPPAELAERTPSFVRQAPEARGPAIEAPSFPALGYFNARTQGASVSGATAAYSNRIKKGDMSRGTLFWPTENVMGGTQVVEPGNYVIGGKSLLLTVGTDINFRMYQDVVLDGGLRSITVNVRYRLMTAGTNGFRIELVDLASGTVLGYYSDPSSGGGSSTWQTRSLTARFEGLAGGVQGPRTMRVRIYPYIRGDVGPTSQQVLVDSVWLVDGEYAAPYRPYTEGIEILRGDDRQLLTNTTPYTAAQPLTTLSFNRVPSNAVGVILDVRISAVAGSTTNTYVLLDDNEGTGAAQQERILSAPANGRWAQTDTLLPFVPSAPNIQWQLVGAAPLNATTVVIRLKAWVLRM